MEPGRVSEGGGRTGRARVSLSCVAAWEPTADQRGGRSAGAPRGCTSCYHRPAGDPEGLVLAEELLDRSKEDKGVLGGWE